MMRGLGMPLIYVVYILSPFTLAIIQKQAERQARLIVDYRNAGRLCGVPAQAHYLMLKAGIFVVVALLRQVNAFSPVYSSLSGSFHEGSLWRVTNEEVHGDLRAGFRGLAEKQDS